MTIEVLSGTSEETAICWWLASQGFIWPEIIEMPDDEYFSFDVDGSGDSGKMILNFLIQRKGASTAGWFQLMDEKREQYRQYAKDPKSNPFKKRDDREWVEKRVLCHRKGKPHYRRVRCLKVP